ncbi:MAG: histidine phosphotransferase family protein [Pseudomonadota bacterium]
MHDLGPPALPDQSEDTLLLATLVASRICHDIVGPVGAIANGIDLMAEAGGEAEEIDLVRQSTDRAASMLRILRIGFGSASAEGRGMSRGALVEVLRKAISGRRVSLLVTGEEGDDLTSETARLVTLMVLSARIALGLSGQIEVVFSHDRELPLRVTAEGERAALSPEAANWLSGALNPAPASREVEFAMLAQAAAAAGLQLTFDHQDGRVTLCVAH